MPSWYLLETIQALKWWFYIDIIIQAGISKKCGGCMKIDLAATLLRLTYLCIIVWLGFDGVFYSIRRVIQYPNQVNLIFSSVLPSFALIFAILWLISDIRMTSPRWQLAFQLVHVIPFLPSLLLILIAPLFLIVEWSIYVFAECINDCLYGRLGRYKRIYRTDTRGCCFYRALSRQCGKR